MSLPLNRGTQPAGLEVTTSSIGSIDNTVRIGYCKISLEDFLRAVVYVLTNTDLKPNDPRLQFVKYVQLMGEVEGYDPQNKRLESPIPAILPNEP